MTINLYVFFNLQTQSVCLEKLPGKTGEHWKVFICSLTQFKLCTMKHILITDPISVLAITSKALILSV